MRHLTARVLVVIGVLTLATGIGLLFKTDSLHAQEIDFTDSEYIGGRECRSCHRDQRDHDETPHALALQDVEDEDDKALILGDFGQSEELPLVQFPDEDEARPITADDIVFAVGSGRHVQRYLYEVDRREHLVLPVQWNVIEQVWEPYTLAEEWPDPAYQWEQNCAYCHTTGLDMEDYRWEDEGVQCEACHGPGSAHADAADDAGSSPSEEELLDIRSLISLSTDSQVCGQCHSQGTSPDDNLPYPTHYLPGQTLVGDTTFNLAPPDDETHWWPTGHAMQANMQFNEWLETAHASALETMQGSDEADDTCLSCHSGDYRFTQARLALFEDDDDREFPPEPITLETAQYGVTCATCHIQHNYDEDGPPPAEAQFALCTDCHSNPTDDSFLHHPVREMFVGEALVDGIDGETSVHYSAENGPTCATCHVPDVPIEGILRASHTLSPIIPADDDSPLPGTCAQCHTDLTAAEMHSLVEDTQTAVQNRLTVALDQVATMDITDLETDAHEQYQQIVTALTFVQNDGSLGVHNYAYADRLLDSAEAGLQSLTGSEAALQPTEAPPTTAPELTDEAQAAETPVPTGIQSMTFIIIGIALIILFIAAVAFFRNTPDREV